MDVSNIITLAVGAVGAIATYYGTMNGAKMQIKNQQEQADKQFVNEMKKLNQARKQQEEFTRKSIENFLSNEIKSNFNKINNISLSRDLTNNSMPFVYLMNYTYKYDEYNSLKHELIKFESDEVKEIINIYDMFYLLERKQGVQGFTQTEYEALKKAYNVCLSKYL
ncbi:hypothetical protein [Peribacillus frigoritolerans]|uniref:hypothetical protein n=1 Tax=Peribacillus frigoritolerans TaxID=450367 RepID=UPI00215B13B7|nr:hypothetical protein [Peribacillus frigoritolerans]MCR8870522.1 hypothetical protein [Peribacillus frigoritolerans]